MHQSCLTIYSVHHRSQNLGKQSVLVMMALKITGKNQKLIATAAKIGDLYHLNCHTSSHNINAAEDRNQETKENVWHRHFGHLGACYLQKPARLMVLTTIYQKKLISVNHVLKENTIKASSQAIVVSKLESHLI